LAVKIRQTQLSQSPKHMSSLFSPATRQRVFFKGAITGLAGSTKTWSALAMATGLANGGKIAVIDTENGSAALYADKFRFDSLTIEPPYLDSKFVRAINNAVAEQYAVLIIDSFSHAWQGILDFKAELDAKGGNSYFHWNQAGSKYNAILAAVLHSPIHVIVCLRAKMDYIIEPDVKGKQVPRKIGLAPVCREGTEFEFSTVFDGDADHHVTVSKDRTGLFVDQHFQISEETGRKLLAWLSSAPEAAAADVATLTPPPEPDAATAGSSPEPASTLEFTPQEQLRQALFGIHEDWVTGFLIDRKKITTGQTVLDAPADYCETALARITTFRKSVVKYGKEHDELVVES
jgi:hypothetical protein